MARRRSKNREVNRTPVYSGARDYIPIANVQLRRPPITLQTLGSSPLLVEDFRRFSPSRVNPALTLSGTRAKTRIQSRVPLSLARMQFAAPKSVLVCVRRHTRKEVLFARKVAGRSGIRKRTNSRFSEVSC